MADNSINVNNFMPWVKGNLNSMQKMGMPTGMQYSVNDVQSIFKNAKINATNMDTLKEIAGFDGDPSNVNVYELSLMHGALDAKLNQKGTYDFDEDIENIGQSGGDLSQSLFNRGKKEDIDQLRKIYKDNWANIRLR
ncbi:MAG: hypothetical protein WCK67_01605 [bacterium]